MLFQAKRGDFGPGNPEELVERRLETWDISGPTQSERTIWNGTVLDAPVNTTS